ncbi:LOB domain-containing protein 27-like [Diospyros lotus]|uniref:LOB domain-containing protein 27-like n=1 Tax=Diospyros lotus TaxID=55363 RepID=UPI002250B35B|nr:LOB domain-containing protein 27-like [Diospyros lotus]
MTLKGGTSQACAACKYQRRRCSSECPLAPYFPPDQPKMFQNAHRLFGVSNIRKILEHIDPSQKMEAMRSIICQANIRERFPVHGCCYVIRQLEYLIHLAEEELHAVHAQLAIYRQNNQQHEISCSPNESTSKLQLGMGPRLCLFHQEAPHPQAFDPVLALPIESHNSYTNGTSVPYNPGFLDKDNMADSFWFQRSYSDGNNNSSNIVQDTIAMQSQLEVSEQLSIQQDPAQEYDEMHPFFDTTIDDRQSYIDSKEPYDSSSDSSLKDTTDSIMNVTENELKSAAACFSLTSVN